MKKNLLLVSVVFISQTITAQVNNFVFKKPGKNLIDNVCYSNYSGPVITHPSNVKKSPNQVLTPGSGVSIIPIGRTGNAFGTSGHAKTNLWADPRIKSVAMIHRSVVAPEPDNDGTYIGSLRYDVSKNSGNNWTNMVGPVYTPDGDPIGPNFSVARYPQGVIYNPPGNTVPDSAFVSYFAPTRNNSNPGPSAQDWGGRAFGTHQFSGLLPATQTQESSNPGTANSFVISEAMTITQQGKIIHVDASEDGSDNYNYIDSLVITTGTFDVPSHDFIYTKQAISVPVSVDNNASPNFSGAYSVAFGKDGMTGYIAILAHNDLTWTTFPDSAFYPVVYKTTDGGATWGSAINVDLDLAGIGDSLGTSAPFTTGFDIDVVVDSANNLHMILAASTLATSGFSINTTPGSWGMFDVYTTDGGTTWNSQILAKPLMFRANFGVPGATTTNIELITDNRPQIAMNWNGTRLFFGWLDSDTTFYDDNAYADLMMRGLNLSTGTWGPVYNITANAPEASALVRFLCMSHYVFDSASIYTVPAAFVKFQNDDPTLTTTTIQLEYIHGIDFDDQMEIILGDNTSATAPVTFNVRNYPNPFNTKSKIEIDLARACDISIRVTDVLGKIVSEKFISSLNSGRNIIEVDASQWNAGVYFYSVISRDHSFNGKMIVQK